MLIFFTIIPAVFDIYTICDYLFESSINIYVHFGTCLVKNSQLRKKIDPHKVKLINGVATVTYAFYKLFPLLFNMNILVSFHSLSLAYTKSFCVCM